MSESTDFASVPGEAVGSLVAAAARLEDDVLRDPETEGESALATEEDDEEDEVPSEFLKTYYCGCGPCHPRWMQFFAHKKIFTFLLCLFSFVQGSLVSGFTSVVLSTIQTRYQFTSTAAGFIAVSYDLTVTISIVFISYFGGKTHRPRWLGVSLIILGVGSFVFASPQFLFGKYKTGAQSDIELELCQDARNGTAECSLSNDLAYSVYILGNVIVGIGGAPLYTVGMAYIDELVYPKYVPLHFGVFQMVSVLGPAFGYGVGSAFLSVYVDPWENTNLTPSDPSWVGAWWIPFILIGSISMLFSIPFLMYPKWLPDSHLVKKERAKEMVVTYSNKFANEDSLTIAVKMFPIHIKRLLKNLPFVFHTISLSSLFILVAGFASFAPKFFQNQFQLTATLGGLYSGGVGIGAAGIGTITGGIILYVTKLRGKKLALFITIVILIMVPITPSFLLNCPSLQVAGISVPYADGSQSGQDSSACSMNCSCTSSVFEPVCGADGLTYFSPCRAGCSLGVDGTNFLDCLCVADSLEPMYSNISHDEIIANYSTAINGRCEHDCSALIPFVIIVLLTFFLVFVIQIPISYFTVRVVADEQRSLALGLNSAVYRVFGTIPGPLLFGALFDTSCLNWQDDCGRRGNCWVYDNNQLSLRVLGFSIPCILLSAFFFLLALLTLPKQQKSIEENENVSIHKRASFSGDGSTSPRRFSLVKVVQSPRRRSSNRYDSTCSDDILLDGESKKPITVDNDCDSDSESDESSQQ